MYDMFGSGSQLETVLFCCPILTRSILRYASSVQWPFIDGMIDQHVYDGHI